MKKSELREIIRGELTELFRSNVLESGAFDKLVHKFAAQGKKNPKGLAAYVGREKYGKRGMARKSAAGRKH